MTHSTTDRTTAILDALKARLAEPGTDLLPLLGTIGRFPRYSLHNQFLIHAQRPDASEVRGFHAWREAGYRVRKGERGIAIYAPLHRRRDAAVADEDEAAAASRLGFRVVYVFDRAQVEPLDGTPSVTAPASAPLTCLEQLKAWLFGHNVELVYHPLPRGTYGAATGTRILCATGLDAPTEFATLVHETAHTLLHFGADRPDLVTRETEAEAIAYVLCTQFGVTDTEASVEYIRCYRGTPETLEGSLARIRATALRLWSDVSAIRFTTSA